METVTRIAAEIPLDKVAITSTESAVKIFQCSELHPNITVIFMGLIILLIGFIGYCTYKNKKKI